MRDQIKKDITDSVRDIFIAFLPIHVQPGPAKLKSDAIPYTPPDTDVRVLVLFAGDVHGGFHLCAQLPVAIALAGLFTGDEAAQFNDELRDGFKELGNMIAGNICTKWTDEYIVTNLSPPILLASQETHAAYTEDSSSFKQYFQTEKGMFIVECFWRIEFL